jgi:capsular polysaccharide transport system ATP-binding protein
VISSASVEQILPPALIEADRAQLRTNAGQIRQLKPRSIELSGIIKEYHTAIGVRRVLDGISFSIGEGEKIAVLGKNGAGKPTLVKIIGGVEPPTAGTVERGLFMSWPIAFGAGSK